MGLVIKYQGRALVIEEDVYGGLWIEDKDYSWHLSPRLLFEIFDARKDAVKAMLGEERKDV